MGTSDQNSESVKLLKALRTFLAEDDTAPSTGDITKNLQRQGVDFSKTLKSITKEAERAQNRLRLQSFRTDVESTVARPLKHVAASIRELKELVAARIASLGAGTPIDAFYRKLETAEEEDLRSLLEDFEDLERNAEDESSSGDK